MLRSPLHSPHHPPPPHCNGQEARLCEATQRSWRMGVALQGLRRIRVLLCLLPPEREMFGQRGGERAYKQTRVCVRTSGCPRNGAGSSGQVQRCLPGRGGGIPHNRRVGVSRAEGERQALSSKLTQLQACLLQTGCNWGIDNKESRVVLLCNPRMQQRCQR